MGDRLHSITLIPSLERQTHKLRPAGLLAQGDGRWEAQQPQNLHTCAVKALVSSQHKTKDVLQLDYNKKCSC